MGDHTANKSPRAWHLPDPGAGNRQGVACAYQNTIGSTRRGAHAASDVLENGLGKTQRARHGLVSLIPNVCLHFHTTLLFAQLMFF